MKRIAFLDGFRGIAILLVVLYHAYIRWSFKTQLDNDLSFVPFIKRGWVGVHLFFLVSGFVILLTLDNSRNFLQFIIKRWLRLFPAMLIGTLLILITAPLLPERPEGIPRLSAAIPGLFFVGPRWIHLITGFNTGVLDGAFWTLFAEVRYYFIFGSLYFLLGKRGAITGIWMFYLVWLSVVLLLKFTGGGSGLGTLHTITRELSFDQFGWFASGSLAYLYYTERKLKYIFYALVVGIISAACLFLPSPMIVLTTFTIPVLFLGTIYFDWMKKMVANRWLLFLGFVSYPLYLIHQNAMVAMIVKLKRHTNFTSDVFLPVVPILLLILVSFFIAKYGEPKLKQFLKSALFRFPLFNDIALKPPKRNNEQIIERAAECESI